MIEDISNDPKTAHQPGKKDVFNISCLFVIS